MRWTFGLQPKFLPPLLSLVNYGTSLYLLNSLHSYSRHEWSISVSQCVSKWCVYRDWYIEVVSLISFSNSLKMKSSIKKSCIWIAKVNTKWKKEAFILSISTKSLSTLLCMYICERQRAQEQHKHTLACTSNSRRKHLICKCWKWWQADMKLPWEGTRETMLSVYRIRGRNEACRFASLQQALSFCVCLLKEITWN